MPPLFSLPRQASSGGAGQGWQRFGGYGLDRAGQARQGKFVQALAARGAEWYGKAKQGRLGRSRHGLVRYGEARPGRRGLVSIR